MNLASKHIQQLLNRDAKKGTRLSIYIPTHPASNSQNLAQDITRFKNALQDIESHPKYDEKELGQTIRSLYELIEDLEFWKHQDIGLAIFANSDGYEHYHLPYEATEASYVQDEYVVSPLVLMHSIGGEFYVLDINLTEPRLLKSIQGTLTPVNKDKTPGSLQDTVARDEYRKELQHSSASRGGGQNQFHGHDPGDEVEHDIDQHLSEVAGSVDEYLTGQDRPLLLAGDQNRVSGLRPHLKYEHTLVQAADGNFESYTPQDLHDAVINIIEKHEADERLKLVEKLKSSDPSLVVKGFDDIVSAANEGRVERMYVPAFRKTTDSARSGDSDTIILQLPDDINEIEATVRSVLLQSGEVLAVSVDDEGELSEPKALCRYSL